MTVIVTWIPSLCLATSVCAACLAGFALVVALRDQHSQYYEPEAWAEENRARERSRT